MWNFSRLSPYFFRFSTILEVYKGTFSGWNVSKFEMKEDRSRKIDLRIGKEEAKQLQGVWQGYIGQGLVGLLRNCPCATQEHQCPRFFSLVCNMLLMEITYPCEVKRKVSTLTVSYRLPFILFPGFCFFFVFSFLTPLFS